MGVEEEERICSENGTNLVNLRLYSKLSVEVRQAEMVESGRITAKLDEPVEDKPSNPDFRSWRLSKEGSKGGEEVGRAIIPQRTVKKKRIGRQNIFCFLRLGKSDHDRHVTRSTPLVAKVKWGQMVVYRRGGG